VANSHYSTDRMVIQLTYRSLNARAFIELRSIDWLGGGGFPREGEGPDPRGTPLPGSLLRPSASRALRAAMSFQLRISKGVRSSHPSDARNPGVARAGGCEHHCEHLFALYALGSHLKIGGSRVVTGFPGANTSANRVRTLVRTLFAAENARKPHGCWLSECVHPMGNCEHPVRTP